MNHEPFPRNPHDHRRRHCLLARLADPHRPLRVDGLWPWYPCDRPRHLALCRSRQASSLVAADQKITRDLKNHRLLTRHLTKAVLVSLTQPMKDTADLPVSQESHTASA